MIISEKLNKELINLEKNIGSISVSNGVTDTQLENFLKSFEKTRYNILSEIKLYNKNLEFDYEKINIVDDNYKAELKDNILKIYVPEIMPSYKNLKTHTHKRILLNIAEVTNKYAGIFDDEVFIYIKLFDNILGWDVDNKYVKPIADALILSSVIKDDNMTKMSYCVKGKYSENPHTEIYVFDSKKINEFLEQYDTEI